MDRSEGVVIQMIGFLHFPGELCANLGYVGGSGPELRLVDADFISLSRFWDQNFPEKYKQIAVFLYKYFECWNFSKNWSSISGKIGFQKCSFYVHF